MLLPGYYWTISIKKEALLPTSEKVWKQGRGCFTNLNYFNL